MVKLNKSYIKNRKKLRVDKMLKLIYGRSGTGKTEYILDYLCSLAKSTDEKLLLLIPEQHSFASEKKILYKIGEELSHRISVLSFKRMTDAVFRQCGGYPQKPVNDGMKNVFMSLALRECCDELRLYKNQANRPEFIPVILNTVNELKSCALSGDDLLKCAAAADNKTLSSKLYDVSIISSVYNALLNQAYSDPLDDLSIIYKRLLEKNIFKDYIIALDGFSGFTRQEMLIIELLMRDANELLLTLCGSKSDFQDGSEVFRVTNETRKRIIEAAHKNSVQIAAPLELEKSMRIKNPALGVLEKNIYSYKPVTEACDCGGITVYQGASVYDECNYTASEIKRLVTECGYKYSDIAVICRNLAPYRGILSRALDKHRISYFMEEPQPLVQKPIISYVLSVLDVISSGFSSEYIFKMLKTGYSQLDENEIFELENYTYIWNISGGKWLSAFTQNPEGFKEGFSEEESSRLNRLERSRIKIIEPLVKFRGGIKDKSGAEITKQLYFLIENEGLREKLREEEKVYIADKNTAMLEELDRVWDILIESLDMMYSSLKDIKPGIKEYADLFRLYLGAEDISYIPRSIDEVTIGTADRIRTDSPKAVFLLGCIQDEFPKAPVAAGIFTDNERCVLREGGLGLYESIAQLSTNELFYAYTAACAPGERLYASFYTQSLDGEERAASSIIREIVGIFKLAGSEHYITEKHDGRFIRCEQDAFEFLASNFSDDSTLISSLKEYFGKTERAAAVQKIDGLLKAAPLEINDSGTAKRLFGNKNMNLSASQIEKYYLCPYNYFCTYGLGLKERKRAEINASEYGTMMHYILEKLLSEYTVAQISEFISNGTLNEKISLIIEDYLQDVLGGAENKTKRFLYSLERIKQGALILIAHIIQELKASEFDPLRCELKIDLEERGGEIEPISIELSDGTKISVRGFVDRVDKLERDGNYYIRIIDYKTGSKEFRINDVDFGLNLQMLLYLDAISKNGEKTFSKKISPAGVLYMPASPSLISRDEGEDSINKSFAMNGVVVNDSPALSEYIDRDGEYISSAFKMSEKELKLCFDKLETLIIHMAKNLIRGKINPLPVKHSKTDACRYCPYSSSCGFDNTKQSNNLSDKKYSPVYGEPDGEGNV